MKKVTVNAVRNLTLLSLLLAGLVYLAACSSGGGPTSSTGGVGSTAPTGVTRGVVTGFGSVYIDGVKYETSSSTVRKNLDAGTSQTSVQDSEVFKKGMVVTVRYGLSDYIVTEVSYRDLLKGPVQNINFSDNTFEVFGVKIYTDNTTQYYDKNNPAFDFSVLANGDIVELSGLIDGDGAIHATYVERKKAGSTEFEVKGYVTNLNNVDNTFVLALSSTASGGISVWFDVNTEFDDMPLSSLDNGVFVEVKTNSTAAPIYAQEIESEEDEASDVSEADEMDVEGYPTDINPTLLTFTLSGVPVAASSSTVYEDEKGLGRTGFADITTSTKLEAEGPISGGVMQAVKIEFD